MSWHVGQREQKPMIIITKKGSEMKEQEERKFSHFDDDLYLSLDEDMHDTRTI